MKVYNKLGKFENTPMIEEELAKDQEFFKEYFLVKVNENEKIPPLVTKSKQWASGQYCFSR